MPRRRSTLERAHDHLLAAAGRHAAIDAGVAHESEAAASGTEETAPTALQAKARTQPRKPGGQFK